jgi:predicted O-methyltransferase YrrM
VPAKAEQARANLARAGLACYADIRAGDARQTLADLGGLADFLLIDGWPSQTTPTLGRSVIELLTPQLRPGALIVNDNGEPDYLAYVRDPANGFLSMSLPLKGATELSLRL